MDPTRARAILQSLAEFSRRLVAPEWPREGGSLVAKTDGLDPATGATFPPNNPYQRVAA